jgi:hypothetical protein
MPTGARPAAAAAVPAVVMPVSAAATVIANINSYDISFAQAERAYGSLDLAAASGEELAAYVAPALVDVHLQVLVDDVLAQAKWMVMPALVLAQGDSAGDVLRDTAACASELEGFDVAQATGLRDIARRDLVFAWFQGERKLMRRSGLGM